MHFNPHALFLPALFMMSGVLAQLAAGASSSFPAVTYPAGSNAFVFCSSQDCTGTCEVVNTDTVAPKSLHDAPNDMGFQSIYWYDPGNYAWVVYANYDYDGDDANVEIGPNTCYNLYYNDVLTDLYGYWYVVETFVV